MTMIIDRRKFISAAGAGLVGLGRARAAAGAKPPFELTVRALTRGPRHHFFGYYGICPWNKSGRKLICLESAFQDRMPEPGEAAAIGLVDAQSGAFEKVTETRAWNLQQGAMLHWNPLHPEREIIHNDLRDGEIVSVVHDVESGKRRILPRPVSAVSHDGRHALSLTYGRVGRLRKVVGYGAARDPNPDDPAPENDGVFLMDLTTGKVKLAVSIAEVYGRLVQKFPELKGRHMWFNHTVFSRDDQRFLFLPRAYLKPNDKDRYTAMFTANLDGSELREAIGFDRDVSHFDWRNEREIVATCALNGSGRKHVLFTDGQRDHRVIGDGFLDFDGHCSFAPNSDWLATDRKDGAKRRQALLIYNVKTGKGHELCRLDMHEAKYIGGNVRCDFHPRWSRAGDEICFDALEAKTGARQLHVAKIRGL